MSRGYPGHYCLVTPSKTGNLESTYRSEDGVTWAQVASSAPWAAREGHALVNVQVGGERRLLVLAGRTVAGGAMTYLSDVWASVDGGVQWQQVRLRGKREGWEGLGVGSVSKEGSS